MKLDCSGCKSEQSMEQSKVSRFSGVVRIIGYLLITPSIIGILFAFIILYATGQATVTGISTAHSEAAQAGVGFAAFLGVGAALFIGVLSLVGGLLGWLLLMKRKVYKCVKCGFILDRA